MRTLGLSLGALRCVHLVDTGQVRIATLGDRKQVVVWHVERDAALARTEQYPAPLELTLIDILGTGGFDAVLCGLEDGRFVQWAWSGNTITDLPLPSVLLKARAATAIAHAHDDGSALYGGADGALWIQGMLGVRWEEKSASPVVALSWSPANRALSSTRDGSIAIWQTRKEEDPRRLATIRGSRTARAVSVSNDGELGLAGRDDGSVEVFAIGANPVARELGTRGAPVRAASFLERTRTAVVARGTKLECWDLSRAEQPRLVWTHGR